MISVPYVQFFVDMCTEKSRHMYSVPDSSNFVVVEKLVIMCGVILMAGQ